MKFYLAGKISRKDWRHQIVDRIERGSPGEILPNSICVDGTQHDYTGPFFSSLGHGMDHGRGSHGNALADGEPSHCSSDLDVFDDSISGIRQSDFVFAFLETPDCYGTICEIGFAYGIGKTIGIGCSFMFSDRWIKDFWFPLETSKYCVFHGHTAREAFTCFLSSINSEQNDGYVYFIEAIGMSRIKIGFSKEPSSRISNLQTGSPFPLSIIKAVPGSASKEKELHQAFSIERIDGEWFHASDRLMKFIRSL